jgi:CBS domain-containing protein
MLAKDLMTRQVVCCPPDATVHEVARMMARHNCGCIPITRSQAEPHQIVGIVTDRDLACRVLARGLDAETAVSAVMTSPAQAIPATASVNDCIRMFGQQQIGRLVVIDEEGRCCGIISQGHVARNGTPQEADELVQRVAQPDGITRARTMAAGASASAGIPGARPGSAR